MFTGLVHCTGTLEVVDAAQVRIRAPGLAEREIAIGDSIAVDGVCLTATQILDDGFVADVSPETRRRSTLSRTQRLKSVNIELSLRVGDKLGGHFVTGHIDGVGQITTIEETATAWELAFSAPADVLRYVVTKGCIAVNGISLTVADCDPTHFWVAVIPHTYQATTLAASHLGDAVNLEADILGKYVEKMLNFRTSPPDLSVEFLREHGYH